MANIFELISSMGNNAIITHIDGRKENLASINMTAIGHTIAGVYSIAIAQLLTVHAGGQVSGAGHTYIKNANNIWVKKD